MYRSALNKPANIILILIDILLLFQFCCLGKHDFFHNDRKYLLTLFKLIKLKFQLATIKSIRLDTLTWTSYQGSKKCELERTIIFIKLVPPTTERNI